jgi:protein SCO1/2
MKNSTSGLLLFVFYISALFSPQILLETASAAEFPEISVVNQDGKPLRMSDFRGKNILLSFVYASCPMPEMCPLTMAINKKIISAWKKDRQPFPFHVVFATLDPEEDGPEEMKTYGTNNKLDFKDFTLITGKNSEMADLSSAFDSAPIPGEKLINHQVVSVLLDPNLKVIKKFFGNKYTYDEIKKLVAASTSQFQGKVTSSDSKINPLALQTNASEESAKFQNQLPKANNTTPSAIDLSERKTLMGIDPKKYDKFWENWRLVNVRYRTSPAEQRFVYANDIAWRTLKSGGAKFEEGAVFAKIAYTVGFDARFPSSYEPNKFSRIQFMKKDSKRYQSTDGWGYALYLQNSDQEEKFGDMELQACHA